MLRFLTLAGFVAILAAAPAKAETTCSTPGEEDCISFQFPLLKSTPDLEREIWALPADKRGWAAVQKLRKNHPAAAPTCGYMYVWMKPTYYAGNPSRELMADGVREFRFKGTRDYDVYHASWVAHKETLPLISDPAYPGLSTPDYVLKGRSVDTGVGWGFPISILRDVSTLMYCPCGKSSYPNRITARMGIVFTEAEITSMISRDLESVLNTALMVE